MGYRFYKNKSFYFISNPFNQEQHFCDYLFNFLFLFLVFSRPLVSHMAKKVGKENDIAFPDFGALSVGGCGGVFFSDCASAMRDAMEQKRQELFPDWPVVEEWYTRSCELGYITSAMGFKPRK